VPPADAGRSSAPLLLKRSFPCFASFRPPSATPLVLRNLTPHEVQLALATRPDVLLLDVREPVEHQQANIAAATLIPLRSLPERLHDIPRERDIVVLCHHGMRSEMAGNFLLAQGYQRVSHMVGGIDRWSVEIDPTVPRY
jgi:rhodanese-related sulfurtransferase